MRIYHTLSVLVTMVMLCIASVAVAETLLSSVQADIDRRVAAEAEIRITPPPPPATAAEILRDGVPVGIYRQTTPEAATKIIPILDFQSEGIYAFAYDLERGLMVEKLIEEEHESLIETQARIFAQLKKRAFLSVSLKRWESEERELLLSVVLLMEVGLIRVKGDSVDVKGFFDLWGTVDLPTGSFQRPRSPPETLPEPDTPSE